MFNLQALMQHISRHLHTIVRRYSASGEMLDRICERTDNDDDNGAVWNDTPYLSPQILKQLLQPDKFGYPKVSSGQDFIAYVTIPYGDSIFLTGPVLLPEEKGYLHTLSNHCCNSQ